MPLDQHIDAASTLVLAGDVELLANGTAEVGSTTDPVAKSLVNGTCSRSHEVRAA